MAIELGTGYVSVVPETKNFSRNLEGQIKPGVTKVGAAAGGVFGSSFAQTVGAALGAVAIAGFIKDVAAAASNLSEASNKVSVVFKSGAREVRAFSNDSARALGLSKRAALEAAGTYGNLFVSMGLAQKKSTDMSLSLVKLASDLASFNNTSTDDALLALRAGLVGETEPLKRFGVNLNEAGLKQKALDMGLVQSASETLPAAIKAQAAYALIMEQTTTAQGDFARTSDGLANKQRILTAEWENAKASLGESLLPSMTSAAGSATNILESFNKLPDVTRNAALGLAATGIAAKVASPYLMWMGKVLVANNVTATETSLALQSLGSGVSLSRMYAAGGALKFVAASATVAGIAVAALALNWATWKAAEASAGSKSAQAAREHAKAIGSATGAHAKWQSATNQSARALGAHTYASKQNNATVTVGVALSQNFTDATKSASGAVAKLVRDIHGLMVAEDSLGGATRTAKEAQLAYRTALLDKKDAHKEVAKLEKAGKKGTDEYTRAQIAAQEADLRAADTKQDLLDAQHDLNTAYITGSTNTKSLTADGLKYSEKLDAATDKVAKLKAKLDTVPKSQRTEVKADIKKAEADVAKLKRQINAIKSKTIQLRVSFTGSGTIRPVVNGRVTQMLVNAYGSIVKHRPGGYLSTMAERGVDEAAIPLENTPRSRALLAEAASRILGGGTSTASASAPAASSGSVDARSYPVFNIASDYDAERAAEILERKRKQSFRSAGQLLVT